MKSAIIVFLMAMCLSPALEGQLGAHIEILSKYVDENGEVLAEDGAARVSVSWGTELYTEIRGIRSFGGDYSEFEYTVGWESENESGVCLTYITHPDGRIFYPSAYLTFPFGEKLGAWVEANYTLDPRSPENSGEFLQFGLEYDGKAKAAAWILRDGGVFGHEPGYVLWARLGVPLAVGTFEFEPEILYSHPFTDDDRHTQIAVLLKISP